MGTPQCLLDTLPRPPVPASRPTLLSRPRRYGISQTMDQVFTAPLVVKHVLCAEHGINEAYIGGRGARVRSQGWVQ